MELQRWPVAGSGVAAHLALMVPRRRVYSHAAAAKGDAAKFEAYKEADKHVFGC
jgi:hypothetical protein